MESRGTITMEDLHQLEKVMDDEEIMSDWMNFLESVEPDFYNYIGDLSALLVSTALKNVMIDTKRTGKIIRIVIMAFVAGYILRYNQNNKLIRNVLDDTKDQSFQRWMQGLFDDKFYAYSTDGMDETSTAYLAKKRHDELKSKKIREKDIEKSRRLFDTMCEDYMDIKNGEDYHGKRQADH